MKRKPLRIVFDANPLANMKSGVGYYVDGLIRGLSAAGSDDVELIGYYFNFLGRKRFNDLPAAPNIRYVQTKAVPGKFLSICRRLNVQPPVELFSHTRADVLLFPNYVALPSIYRSPRFAFVHDLGYIDYPEFVSLPNLRFLKKWVPRTIRTADSIVTISQFTKQRIIDTYGVPERKLHVTPIPPVVSTAHSSSNLERFNIHGKYILFVGTIEPRKNIRLLMDAYALLPKQIRSNHSLVLAGGKGWNDEDIVSRFNELHEAGENIILTGYVSDEERSALYDNAEFCVLPSIYEGFGMPIFEAMSYGKAVICSDLEVFHEIAGDTVQYFDTNEPESLRDAIELCIRDARLRQKTAAAGVKRLHDVPDWTEVATGLLERIRSSRAR